MVYTLITGASKGIGLSIAKELAKRKFNVILLARDGKMLQENVSFIRKVYNVEADFIALDLTESNAIEILISWLKKNDYKLNALINNAGYGLSGQIQSYPLSEHENMMELNMLVPVRLIYSLLPLLRLEPKGYIMNIGSTASYQSIPGLNVYAASKSFILSFSRGLKHELKGTGISVTVVSPGATDTNFVDRAKVKSQKAIQLAKATNMHPDVVAKLAVDAMLSEKTEVITGVLNKLGVFLSWLLPKKFIEKNIASIYLYESNRKLN
jgi:short-subunit dehydrogenase